MIETMTEKVTLERRSDGIAIITFNRPEALNALDLAAMNRFAEIVQCLEDDSFLRVVILTGAGQDAFCSGGDLVELSQYPTEDDALSFITVMGDALLRLECLPVPVIAAVNGYALGGGSEIAVACDLRITDDQTRMGFVQIRMGLTPGWGAGQRLLRLVGYSRAMDILLHGQVMHVPQIEALGLTNKVVAKGTALQHALSFAEQIVQNPPELIHSIKALLRAGLENPYEEALQIEREVFPSLWASDAHLNAVNAFLERNRQRKEKS